MPRLTHLPPPASDQHDARLANTRHGRNAADRSMEVPSAGQSGHAQLYGRSPSKSFRKRLKEFFTDSGKESRNVLRKENPSPLPSAPQTRQTSKQDLTPGASLQADIAQLRNTVRELKEQRAAGTPASDEKRKLHKALDSLKALNDTYSAQLRGDQKKNPNIRLDRLKLLKLRASEALQEAQSLASEIELNSAGEKTPLNALPLHIDLLNKSDKESFELNLAVINSLLREKASPMGPESINTLLEAAHRLGELNSKCEQALTALLPHRELESFELLRRESSIMAFQNALNHAVDAAIGSEPPASAMVDGAPVGHDESHDDLAPHEDRSARGRSMADTGPMDRVPPPAAAFIDDLKEIIEKTNAVSLDIAHLQIRAVRVALGKTPMTPTERTTLMDDISRFRKIMDQIQDRMNTFLSVHPDAKNHQLVLNFQDSINTFQRVLDNAMKSATGSEAPAMVDGAPVGHDESRDAAAPREDASARGRSMVDTVLPDRLRQSVVALFGGLEEAFLERQAALEEINGIKDSLESPTTTVTPEKRDTLLEAGHRLVTANTKIARQVDAFLLAHPDAMNDSLVQTYRKGIAVFKKAYEDMWEIVDRSDTRAPVMTQEAPVPDRQSLDDAASARTHDSKRVIWLNGEKSDFDQDGKPLSENGGVPISSTPDVGARRHAPSQRISSIQDPSPAAGVTALERSQEYLRKGDAISVLSASSRMDDMDNVSDLSDDSDAESTVEPILIRPQRARVIDL